MGDTEAMELPRGMACGAVLPFLLLVLLGFLLAPVLVGDAAEVVVDAGPPPLLMAPLRTLLGLLGTGATACCSVLIPSTSSASSPMSSAFSLFSWTFLQARGGSGASSSIHMDRFGFTPTTGFPLTEEATLVWEARVGFLLVLAALQDPVIASAAM